MNFRKNIFCKLFVACIWVACYAGDVYSTTCSGVQAVASGYYCTASTATVCPKGCFCPGGSFATVTLGYGPDRCNDTSGQYAPPSPGTMVNVGGGAYRCYSGYSTSALGTASAEGCQSACGVHYKAIGVSSTKYLKAGRENADDCLAGYKCPGAPYGVFIARCNGDQGIYQCGVGEGKELEYAPAGASTCSTCDADGKRVVTNGELHVGCEFCPDGKYTTDHQNCLDCPAGYKCQQGVRTLCDGSDQYSNAGQSECSTCSATGKGVTYTSEQVDGETIQLHTGCETCRAGYYAVNGVCTICPAGHYCQGGQDKGECQKGWYSRQGQSSCSQCARYMTTENTGSTTSRDCFLVRSKLKTAISGSVAVPFPVCLFLGNVNMSVVRQIN